MTFTQLSKPETYMTIHADGRITVSDKLKPDETAARVLECMKNQFLGDAQATKIRELQDRIKRLEAVVNDPHALWVNWLRGNVKLPVGIGDVREYQDRIKRLEEALETLTCVIGLTPIEGNLAALQEAFDMACAVLKAKEAKL